MNISVSTGAVRVIVCGSGVVTPTAGAVTRAAGGAAKDCTTGVA